MEIVATLAKERRVEQMVSNICHRDLDADLKDLCQLVYCVLLEYDEDKIVDLWEHGRQIDFFIVRIILNQYKSTRSTFYAEICRFRHKGVMLGAGGDISDKSIENAKRR